MKEERKALKCLQRFIKILSAAGITNKESYREWRKQRRNEKTMERLFRYKRESNKMPSVTALVGVFFHPGKPLIGLNYTAVAHNTLHQFQSGWTMPLRLCRGIIFDKNGLLVAKPFTKFFNYGEHEETKNLPDEEFEATVKHDGHLGIIFEYDGELLLTTRGSFESPSSIIGSKMLAEYCAKYKWGEKLSKDITVLVEIIHPSTKVHTDYRSKKKFILIGASDRTTLEDFDHKNLVALGELLNIEVTELWSGNSIKDLRKLMDDLSVENREGFVARFKSGPSTNSGQVLRVKFKFATYINKMVAAKLSYRYLMRRIMAGNLEKMTKNLPAEEYEKAREMLEKLMKAKDDDLATEKERRAYLYNLIPTKESTAGYRDICRKFLKFVESTQPKPMP